jgi:hypothetical protein
MKTQLKNRNNWTGEYLLHQTNAKNKKNSRFKIFLYITEAGGGHMASARALKEAVQIAQLNWDIKIINVYREIFFSLEPFRKIFGVYAEDAYNFVLKNNLLPLTWLMRPAAIWAATGLQKKSFFTA